MREETKTGLQFLVCCALAMSGAFVSGSVTAELWKLHYGNQPHLYFGAPMVQMLFGLLLGFVTGVAWCSRSAQSALRSGYIFLFIVTALFVTEARAGTRLLVCVDSYALSFLWALSLIVVGSVFRDKPRKNAA